MWTCMRFVDIAVKICRTFPIILYDVGPFFRNRFGMRWTHLVRERGVFSYRLFLCRFQWSVQISCNLGKISESLSIATICESSMLVNGDFCTGFCRAWANLCAAMMIFSEEELYGRGLFFGKNSTQSESRSPLVLVMCT